MVVCENQTNRQGWHFNFNMSLLLQLTIRESRSSIDSQSFKKLTWRHAFFQIYKETRLLNKFMHTT